jgi:hypothetical protein
MAVVDRNDYALKRDRCERAKKIFLDDAQEVLALRRTLPGDKVRLELLWRMPPVAPLASQVVGRMNAPMSVPLAA